MFILYAIPIGIVVGYLLGGRLERLATCASAGRRSRWSASLVQVVIFTEPSVARSATPRRRSTSPRPWPCFAAVLRNLDIPGVALIAVGAGVQPRGDHRQRRLHAGRPGGARVGRRARHGLHEQHRRCPDPALRPLTDIFALPAWLPFANVFSIGDVLIGIGIAATIALAMRDRAAEPVAEPDASHPAMTPVPTSARACPRSSSGRPLVYLFLVVVLRITGKREVGQMSILELIVILLISRCRPELDGRREHDAVGRAGRRADPARAGPAPEGHSRPGRAASATRSRASHACSSATAGCSTKALARGERRAPRRSSRRPRQRPRRRRGRPARRARRPTARSASSRGRRRQLDDGRDPGSPGSPSASRLVEDVGLEEGEGPLEGVAPVLAAAPSRGPRRRTSGPRRACPRSRAPRPSARSSAGRRACPCGRGGAAAAPRSARRGRPASRADRPSARAGSSGEPIILCRSSRPSRSPWR